MHVYLHGGKHRNIYGTVSVNHFLRCFFPGLIIAVITCCIAGCDAQDNAPTPEQLPNTGLESNTSQSSQQPSSATDDAVVEGASETIIQGDGVIYEQAVIIDSEPPPQQSTQTAVQDIPVPGDKQAQQQEIQQMEQQQNAPSQ
ncbi:hypothetical protein [Parendozoicomonas haliclonae]|uniref:Uncharacterized protein n=1 Tax=Parendozoicomonas haliclonae TaxID=1960125 RepID=A0A1X7AKT3_9GAMM|nr:hypothetical protein [Parendozoicomonas haliclonae]SMA48341.1 hypothetical protein EHSB41UT_02703 [Parendozoicomonas haliclonae]